MVRLRGQYESWWEQVADHAMWGMGAATVSLDDPVTEGDRGLVLTRADTLPADQPTPEEEVIRRDENRRRLRHLREVLDRREIYCLTEYFVHGRLLREIGEDLGLCRERVRQIVAAALRRARGGER